MLNTVKNKLLRRAIAVVHKQEDIKKQYLYKGVISVFKNRK
jgi:hypothetical protein